MGNEKSYRIPPSCLSGLATKVRKPATGYELVLEVAKCEIVYTDRAPIRLASNL